MAEKPRKPAAARRRAALALTFLVGACGGAIASWLQHEEFWDGVMQAVAFGLITVAAVWTASLFTDSR